MSFDSFENFFETGKTDKSKIANLEMITKQLFAFTEKVFTELATVVDQLDAKVTSLDQTIRMLSSKIDNMSRAPPPSPTSLSASPSNMGMPSPPVSGGLPPLPGLTPPPVPGGSFGSGLVPPPASDPSAKPSPMAAQAAIRNELQEAFKKIRQNLNEDS